MKTFLLFSCVILLAVAYVSANHDSHESDESHEHHQKHHHGLGSTDVHNECQKDPATHIDEEDLKKIRKGEQYDKVKLGAHSKCMLEKSHILKANGEVDKAQLSKIVKERGHSDEIVHKIEECVQHKDTPEETSLHVMKCYYDHAHAHHH
nr:unnamed protein product [Callosobruchus analis]